MKKFANALNKYFGINEADSTIKTEVLAGLTTFFAMAYILVVNPATISSGVPKIYNAVYIATALSAFLGTILYAFLAKLPFAQASGMGLNAFFFVSFILPAFLTGGDPVQGYQKGLAVIILSGIVFIILSVTGARKAIAESMPDSLKKAIPAGIGLFIAFIGLKNAGIIQPNQYTFVQLGNVAIEGGKLTVPAFNNPLNIIAESSVSGVQIWYTMAPLFIAFIGLLLIAVLHQKKVKGSVFIGIIAMTAVYYLFNIGNKALFDGLAHNDTSLGQAFKDFGEVGIFRGFVGFKYFESSFAGVMSVIMLVITFTLVDLFDTLGTLQGTAAEAGMLDENGLPIKLNKALMCDSIATLGGAIFGTSTVTTYVESSAGVSAGGRTGLTSLVTAICFLIFMLFAPLAKYIPSAATAPALIFVGVLMLKNIKEVDFSDLTSAVPAFLTLVLMPLTYSISNGIAVGMIAHVIMKLATLKYTKKDIIPSIIAALFIIRFFAVKM